MIETVSLIPTEPDLVAHFSRRYGGVSPAPYDSLNLGLSTADDDANVVENRRRLARHLRAPFECWVVAGQVHGARVLTATPELAGLGTTCFSPSAYAADAVFLPEPGIFALSLSADCPLVVIADADRGRAGVAHAGWRGTGAGVIEALLESFVVAGSERSRLVAGISPGICGDCYPVGDEVFETLSDKPGLVEARHGNRLDLRRIHRQVLLDGGLDEESITVAAACSLCSADFFSHRGDQGRTGRCGAVVGWRR